MPEMLIPKGQTPSGKLGTKGFPIEWNSRKAMRSKVMEQQVKLVLSTGKLISPQQQDKIFKHIMEVEAPEMGQTQYAIMSTYHGHQTRKFSGKERQNC